MAGLTTDTEIYGERKREGTTYIYRSKLFFPVLIVVVRLLVGQLVSLTAQGQRCNQSLLPSAFDPEGCLCLTSSSLLCDASHSRNESL